MLVYRRWDTAQTDPVLARCMASASAALALPTDVFHPTYQFLWPSPGGGRNTSVGLTGAALAEAIHCTSNGPWSERCLLSVVHQHFKGPNLEWIEALSLPAAAFIFCPSFWFSDLLHLWKEKGGGGWMFVNTASVYYCDCCDWFTVITKYRATLTGCAHFPCDLIFPITGTGRKPGACTPPIDKDVYRRLFNYNGWLGSWFSILSVSYLQLVLYLSCLQ